jgi:hypothetical protein
MSLMVGGGIHRYKCVIKQVVLVKWGSKYMKHYWSDGSRWSWSNFNSCPPTFTTTWQQPSRSQGTYDSQQAPSLVGKRKLKVGLWNFILFVYKQTLLKNRKKVWWDIYEPQQDSSLVDKKKLRVNLQRLHSFHI